jgi:hypothetical protein
MVRAAVNAGVTVKNPELQIMQTVIREQKQASRLTSVSKVGRIKTPGGNIENATPTHAVGIEQILPKQEEKTVIGHTEQVPVNLAIKLGKRRRR